MIVATDPELYAWCAGIIEGVPCKSGDFLHAVALAAVRADAENYMILRPALLQLKDKYPTYDARKAPSFSDE